MNEWVGKDPAKAIAWMDQQIAAGKFDSKSLDGKSNPRMRFEGMMISSLLSTNPTAAADRLAGLPEDQQSEVLRDHTGNAVKEENQLAYAELVRSEMPEKEQADTLAQKAGELATFQGYEKVTEYLDRIEASPSERAEAVRQSVDRKIRNLSNKVTRDDIDSMREWAASQSPEVTNTVTGTALAFATQSAHPSEFSEAAELAIQYNDAGGGDDVLVGFLNEVETSSNKEAARVLAGRIADPKSREKILKKLK